CSATPRRCARKSSSRWSSAGCPATATAGAAAGLWAIGNSKAAAEGPGGFASRQRNGRLVALALEALAQELAVAAHRFGLLAGATLGRLLVIAAELHLAKHAFALHLLFQRSQRLVDIVVADEH